MALLNIEVCACTTSYSQQKVQPPTIVYIVSYKVLTKRLRRLIIIRKDLLNCRFHRRGSNEHLHHPKFCYLTLATYSLNNEWQRSYCRIIFFLSNRLMTWNFTLKVYKWDERDSNPDPLHNATVDLFSYHYWDLMSGENQQ
jgi:hypothetical protein